MLHTGGQSVGQVRWETITDGGSVQGQESRGHVKLGPCSGKTLCRLSTGGQKPSDRQETTLPADQLSAEGARDDRCCLMAYGACGQGTNGRAGHSARKDSSSVSPLMLSVKVLSHYTVLRAHP